MTTSKSKPELRFAFGKNWKRYLKNVGRSEIEGAKKTIETALYGKKPEQCSFLDIGSGSGLFSRAAFELGFKKITSFDYDSDCVEATGCMKNMASAPDETWEVMQGNVLDETFLKTLGQYDFVYSWGVLHHTGDMWKALDLASNSVKEDGSLFIAIYNDQGWVSKYWTWVKRLYVSSGNIVKFLMLLVYWTYFGMFLLIADLLRFRNPIKRHFGDKRGMKFFTDVIDWVGGYPFEVASSDVIIEFYRKKGFECLWHSDVGIKHGCNEFIFKRRKSHDDKNGIC